MRRERYYVRKLWSYAADPSCECSDKDECTHELVRSVLYEVYTQPRMDYLKARLYHAYDMAMFKSGLEKVQDWFWHLGYEADNDDLIPPSVEHDCRCYSLDVRNHTIIGRVVVPDTEEDSMSTKR